MITEKQIGYIPEHQNLPSNILSKVGIFLKLGQPQPLFHLFSAFSYKQYNYYNKSMLKCPSSIWCWDSNPQPLKHESSPNTLKIVYDIRPMCFFPVQLLQYFLHNWMLLLRRFPHWGPILQVFLTLITYWCKKVILDLVNKQHCIFGAGITQWIRLHLPYCGPGFESQAHHQYIFHLLSILYYYCHCVAIRTKTNKKRPSLANMKNKLHIQVNLHQVPRWD